MWIDTLINAGLTFRQSPETFLVEEQLFYRPDEQGGHRFVWIEKKACSTYAAKRNLSEMTGVPLKSIRHAGQKDQQSTARQWISWPLDQQKAPAQSCSRFKLIKQSRHRHGLKIGHIQRNRFTLILNCQHPSRLVSVQNERFVFPNLFGKQRFQQGGSVEQAIKNARTPFDYSQIQSELFNQFAQWRFAKLGCEPQAGDLYKSIESKKVFRSDLDDELNERIQSGEVSATGPLFGPKMMEPHHNLEQLFLTENGWRPALFAHFGKKGRGSRRALFSAANHIDLSKGVGDITLSFTLNSGSYATVFLLALTQSQRLWLPHAQWPTFLQETALDGN